MKLFGRARGNSAKSKHPEIPYLDAKSEHELLYHYHRLFGVTVSSVTDYHAKKLKTTDFNYQRALFQMYIFAGVLTRRVLVSQNIKDASKLSQRITLDASSIAAGDSGLDGAMKAIVIRDLDNQYTKYGMLPYEQTDKPRQGTFVWEYSKFLTEVFTGEPAKTQLEAMLQVNSAMSGIAENLELVLFTEKLKQLRS